MKLTDLTEASLQQERALKDTKWESPNQVEKWLRDNGFKQAGKGGSATVWHAPSHNRIIRVGNKYDPCWMKYASWALQRSGHPNLPRFFWVKGDDTFNISVIERLQPISRQSIVDTVDFPGMVDYYISGEVFEQFIDDAIEERLRSMGIEGEDQIRQYSDQNHQNSFSHVLNAAFNMKGECHYDLHNENIMYRPATKNMVVIDPLSELASHLK